MLARTVRQACLGQPGAVALGALVFALCAGCLPAPASVDPAGRPDSPSAPSTATSALRAPREPPEALSFEANVRVPTEDEQGKSRKVFRGVLLERDDGSRWVATYERDELWEAFAGRRVVVSGERYVPRDQSLINPHIRVNAWRLVKPGPDAPVHEVGPERTLEGRLEDETWPAGTKLEGEKTTRFLAVGGDRYLLAHVPAGTPHGRKLRVRARVVVPSPFDTRPGGDYLWIFDAAPE